VDQRVRGIRASRIYAQRFAQLRDRVVRTTFLEIEQSKVRMGRGEIRLFLNSTAEKLFRFHVAMFKDSDDP
jgi:hypothetical protein